MSTQEESNTRGKMGSQNKRPFMNLYDVMDIDTMCRSGKIVALYRVVHKSQG